MRLPSLRTRSEFKRVFDEGKRYPGAAVSVFVLAGPTRQTRVGLVVPRRLGSAVVRNRTRRRLRSALVPLLGEVSPGTEIVVLAKSSTASFQEMEEELSQILARTNRA